MMSDVMSLIHKCCVCACGCACACACACVCANTKIVFCITRQTTLPTFNIRTSLGRRTRHMSVWSARTVSLTADGLTAAHQGQCAGRRLRGDGREGAVETTAHKTDLGSIRYNSMTFTYFHLYSLLLIICYSISLISIIQLALQTVMYYIFKVENNAICFAHDHAITFSMLQHINTRWTLL